MIQNGGRNSITHATQKDEPRILDESNRKRETAKQREPELVNERRKQHEFAEGVHVGLKDGVVKDDGGVSICEETV